MLNSQKRLSNSFFALLSLPATAMGFALSVQISALSWILGTKYQLEIHDIGLVWAAGPIAGIFGQIIFGIISDNVWFWNGRRRPFILIGGVLSALMLLALPYIDVIAMTLGFEGVLGVAIAVALTLDLAINVSFNPTRSIIADVTPEGEKRTQGYTWMQTISGTFGVLAYVIGSVWGNYTLIYSGAILVFILAIFPTFFIEEPRELKFEEAEESGTAKTTSFVEILKIIEPLWGFLIYGFYGIVIKLAHIEKTNYYVEYSCLLLTLGLIIKALSQKEAGKNKSEAGLIGFKKVLAAHSFTWVGVQTMFVYMFSYVQATMPDFSGDELGKVVANAFLIFSLVAAILPALVLEPMSRKIGRAKTHTICIAIMAIGYAGIWLAGFSTVMIYILMAIVGIGWAATVSLPFAIMSVKVEQSKMGLYMGLFNLSVVLPQLVASLGIGEIVSAAEDKSLIFIICTASLAISAVLWFFVKDEK